MYSYSAVQWTLIFYIYCVFGWIFESTVVSVQQRRLVNRGFLHGPMLPIYGFGAVIMLHVALPLDGHPVLIFFAGMIVATAFEYVVGVLMETLFKVRYWDYSEHRFQFQGRICLQSSLAWGALSLALPYALHRPVAWLVACLTPVWTLVLTGCVTAYFVWDVIVSTRTALNLAKLIEELEKMRVEIDDLRAQFAAQAAETREKLAAASAEARARMNEIAEERLAQVAEATREKEVGSQLMAEAAEARAKLEAVYAEARAQITAASQEQHDRILAAAEESRLQLYLAVQEAEDRMNARIRAMRADSKWIVRGNPTMRSAKYRRAGEELRRRLKKR